MLGTLGLKQAAAVMLALAALVASSATLFGFEFADDDGHEGTETTRANGEGAVHEHGGTGAHESSEDESDEGASKVSARGADEVLAAAVIGLLGGALLPLTAARIMPGGAERSRGSEPGVTLADRLAIELAALSLGAAIIHFAVIAEHFDEWWLAGMFFVAAGIFQLAWALQVLARPSTSLYLWGGLANALIIVTWIVSRTVGLPIGPDAGEPEPVGLADALTTSFEAVIVALVAVLAGGWIGRAFGSRLATPSVRTAWVVSVALLAALGLVALG